MSQRNGHTCEHKNICEDVHYSTVLQQNTENNFNVSQKRIIFIQWNTIEQLNR